MQCQAVLQIAALVVVVLITLGIALNSFDPQGLVKGNEAKSSSEPKCGLSDVCPLDHFAFSVRSGAANFIGPNICFDGETILSYALNNIGTGLNIVVLNGENGVVENSCYLNTRDGSPEAVLHYLKSIRPGRIVLVASFDDVATKMTNGIREEFVGMGSTLITNVKQRDSWVFAGRVGMTDKSLYEKHAPNDVQSNLYNGWPQRVEVRGCFPRTVDEDQP